MGAKTSRTRLHMVARTLLENEISFTHSHTHLNYLGAFLRFRRTFAEVITSSGASAHEF